MANIDETSLDREQQRMVAPKELTKTHKQWQRIILTSDGHFGSGTSASNGVFALANINRLVGEGHSVQDERLVRGIDLGSVMIVEFPVSGYEKNCISIVVG